LLFEVLFSRLEAVFNAQNCFFEHCVHQFIDTHAGVTEHNRAPSGISLRISALAEWDIFLQCVPLSKGPLIFVVPDLLSNNGCQTTFGKCELNPVLADVSVNSVLS
jgi:hypothetical protein